MASFGIGAKLRQERVGRGLTIDDVARATKISPRYLEAIERDDFGVLPGLVFTRNFVRQFALALNVDPDPLVAELPRQDESTVRLPEPPARSRSSYSADRRIPSGLWLVFAAAAAGLAWFHFNHAGPAEGRGKSAAPVQTAEAASPPAAPVRSEAPPQAVPVTPVHEQETPSAPVEVVITAHQPSWIQVTADGKTVFTGTLQPHETKQIDAMEKVKLIAGNAGGLTVSLNGKTLDPLGSAGQVRVLTLTAGGPEFLPKDPQPAPDPL